MSSALVLLDESGDLGWKLDLPYRSGGSSRFFTIAGIVGEDNKHRKFGQLMRNFRKAQGWSSKKEKKWIHLGEASRVAFAHEVVKLRKNHPELPLLVSVIEKSKVPPHIHGHFHLVYSWLASSLIASAIRHHRHVSICPDELNAGVGSQSLIENILRKELWFNLRTGTEIQRTQRTQALEDGLAFCDFLAGAVQSKFEDGNSSAFDILQPYIFLHRPWH